MNQQLAPEKADHKLSFKLWLLFSALFAGLLCIIFKSFIFDSSVLLLSSDQIQGFGMRYLRDGFVMTQWNPYLLGGIPTYDAMFGDISHPFVLLERIMAPERAVGFKFILCSWLAFITALPLFSLLGRSWKIGALVAALFALNPQFLTLVYGGHDGKMMAVSVLPLALWGLFLITRKGNWMGMFWLALGIALMLLSSHLQTTYYILFGLLAISLYENFLREKVENFRLAISRQLAIGVGVLVALAIGAVQILPPVDYTNTMSVRSTTAKTTMEHATSWSLHPEEAVTLLLPGFSGNLPEGDKDTYWGINSFKLNHDAPGMLLVILGFAAFSALNRRREHILWAWMLSICLIYALGAHTPWFQAFFELLPKAKMFRAPSMVLFWVPMILGIMGSLWLGDVRRGEVQLKSGFIWTYLSLCGAFVLARSSWFEHSPMLWYGLVLISTVLAWGAWRFQELGQKISWGQIPAKALEQVKAKPALSLGLLLPWLALLPIKSSIEVQSRGLSEAVLPLEQWQSARELIMKNQSGEAMVSFFIGAMLVGILWWALRKANTWNFAFLALGIFGAAEAWYTDAKFIQTEARDQIFKPEADALAQKAKTIAQGQDYRVLNLGRTLENGYGPYYGLRMVLGFHDNEIASYRTFRSGKDDDSRMGNLLWTPSPEILQASLRAQGMDSTQIQALFTPKPMDLVIAMIMGQNPNIPADAIQQQLSQMPQEQLQSYWGQVQEAMKAMPEQQKQALLAKAASISLSSNALPLVMQNGLNPYLNLLGVKAIVMGEEIVQNPKAMSRLTGFSQYTVEAQDSLAVAEIAPMGAQPSSIILNREPAQKANGSVQAKLEKTLRADHYQGQSTSDKGGFVLFNENYSPNWHVQVNGKEVPTYKAFGTFVAFEVPAGQSQIDIQYSSAALHKALPLSLIGLVILIGLLVFGVYSQRKLKLA